MTWKFEDPSAVGWTPAAPLYSKREESSSLTKYSGLALPLKLVPKKATTSLMIATPEQQLLIDKLWPLLVYQHG